MVEQTVLFEPKNGLGSSRNGRPCATACKPRTRKRGDSLEPKKEQI